MSKSIKDLVKNPALLFLALGHREFFNWKGFSPFNPYTNPYLSGLYRRGWLPSFVSKKKLMAIQNKIECESHLERLKYVVQEELKV